MKMKGSDKVEMKINIGGEILTLTTDFDKQEAVRDAEADVRQYYNKLKKEWPDSNDRQILAMAAYQFSFWCRELRKIQDKATDLVGNSLNLLEKYNVSNKC